MEPDWASKKADELCGHDQCSGEPRCGNCRAIAAALREAREPLGKEIAVLHDLLTGCLSRLNPEEFPEWCEKIGEVLTCGQDGNETPCTHYQKEMEEVYRDGFQQGREQGAADREAQIIATLEDLHLRPQDGGPAYYVKRNFGTFDLGDPPTVYAIQPRQIEPVFKAMRDAIGGYEKLAEWRKRNEDEAFERGLEQGAREEREACYEVVTLTFAQFRGAQAPVVERRVSDAIAARGPMQEGGGE